MELEIRTLSILLLAVCGKRLAALDIPHAFVDKTILLGKFFIKTITAVDQDRTVD
jgi:hypothetical protein